MRGAKELSTAHVCDSPANAAHPPLKPPDQKSTYSLFQIRVNYWLINTVHSFIHRQMLHVFNFWNGQILHMVYLWNFRGLRMEYFFNIYSTKTTLLSTTSIRIPSNRLPVPARRQANFPTEMKKTALPLIRERTVTFFSLWKINLPLRYFSMLF